MTLRAKLILSTLFEIFLILLVSGFLIASSRQIDRATANETRAVEIVETVSQIRFVTFENLLNRSERSFEQWQLKHDDLATLLIPVPSQSPKEQTLLQNIKQQSEEVGIIFNRIIASYNETQANQATPIQQAFQDRLATQLLTKQQMQISDALKLSDIARNEAAGLRRQSNVLVVAVILLMFLIMAVNIFFIIGVITRALFIFQTGAEKIAGGKFDYRIKTHQKNDELGRLATAFNSMAASLEQIDKVKSDFILLASHQLRTPLTSIKWSSEALASAGKPLAQDKQQHYIKQIHESNERMIKLVNELLNVSKIGLGTTSANPEPVRLDSVLDQVVDDLSPLARKNKITISKRTGKQADTIMIDPAWAHIIFKNLISNSLRYSPPNARVDVTISRSESETLIKVADNGYGIPADEQSEVFTKLFRAANAKRIVGEGSGLGLYIVKALVEKYGGKIWFESVENLGSTFYVKLPVNDNKSGK